MAKNVPPPAKADVICVAVSNMLWPTLPRVVSVREQNEMTEVYFWKKGTENGGLVVISAESNELTVVNIVGRIDLAALASLGPPCRLQGA